MKKYIVIISREGKVEAIKFDDLDEAVAYADYFGAQWSETYVCEIIKGPVV